MVKNATLAIEDEESSTSLNRIQQLKVELNESYPALKELQQLQLLLEYGLS